MAAINASTLPSSSFRPFTCQVPKNAAHLSFCSHFSHSTAFPSLSSKPHGHKSSRSSLTSTVISAFQKLSETDSVTVSNEIEQHHPQIPSDSGVYAVYDKNNDLQFIGISRNIGASILHHRKSVPDLCHSVKVGVVDDPDRTALTQVWKSWMEEYIGATGKVPPGNETGNTTWVPQSVQKKKKPDLRLTPGRHMQLTVQLEELIDRLVKENKVVAFIKGSRSAPLCGFSQRVVGILESEGVEYESVDVLDEEYNYGLRESLKRYSNWPTFPQVFVNGELVGGCDIISAMHEKGELGSLLSKSS